MAIFKDNRLRRMFQELKLSRKQVQKTENAKCFILELPSELILEILDFVPLYSRIVLSQTCRPLRTLLRPLRNTAQYLPRNEFLEFLACFARDLTDRWICDQCLKLHKALKYDFPRQTTKSSCPRGFSHDFYPIGANQYLCHRHIQLALKYTRLDAKQKKHSKYIENVIAPYHTNIRWGVSEAANGLIIRQSYYPKIVQGAFLMLNVKRFHKHRKAKNVTVESLRYHNVCWHQLAVSPIGFEPKVGDPRSALALAVREAFKAGGKEIRGSCQFCPTDFSVQACPERVTLRAWYDLGPEGSPAHPAWKIRTELNSDRSKFVPNEKPGKVRELYESE